MKSRVWLALAFAVITACGKRSPLTPVTNASIATPPDTFTLVIKGYRPQAGATRLHLFVSNFSTRVVRSELLESRARDGLTDTLKRQLSPEYGFNLDEPESVVTGFADLLLFKLGIRTPQQNLLFCALSQRGSAANDALTYADPRLSGSPVLTLGLRDCEKQYLNLDPNLFDYVGNGIPDYLKLRCGLNTLNASDAFVSTAGDGVANIDKCKQNIPIDERASDNQVFAYRYASVLNTDGSEDLTVSNIPITNQGADNFVAMYVVEQDLTTQATALYTAFAILKSGYVNRTLNVSYWATSPAQFTNRQVAVP